MANKRAVWRRWIFRSLIVIVALWLIVVIGLVMTIVAQDDLDQRQPADVIVVLGAGLSRDGRPGYALTRRSNLAAELWQQGYAPTIICTGGQASNQTRSEAEGCQQVLNRRGVPDSAILLEDQSRSTEENALYSREIINANNWNDVLLVTDSFHIFRAQLIFRTRGLNVIPVAVPRAAMRDGYRYDYYVLREVAAIHWQIIKDMLNLPVTHVP